MPWERRPAVTQRVLVDELARDRAGDPARPLTVVAPSWEAAIQLSRRLAHRLGGKGHLGVRFITPGRLVQDLATPALAARGLRPLPPWGLELLCREAAGRHTGYYRDVCRRPGFAPALARAVGTLRMHGVPAGRLRKAAGGVPADERDRLASLAELYEDVAAHLAPASAEPAGREAQAGGGRFFDLPALFSAAIREASEGQAARAVGGDRIWLWGSEVVFEPGHLWHALVRALAAPGSGVSVAYHPLGPDDPALPRDVRRLVATDEIREAEDAARELLQAAEDGTLLYRMAAVCRSEQPYVALLTMALERARLDPFVPASRRLSRAPAGQALTGWLELVQEEFPRRRLLDWLGSRHVRLEWLGLSAGEMHPGAWHALTAALGVVRGVGAWEDRLRAATTGGARVDEEALAPFRRLMTGLLEHARQVPRAATWAEYAELCGQWVQEAARADSPDDDDAMRVKAAVYELAGLDRLVASGATVTLGEFRQALQAHLDGLRRANRGGFEQGRPTVLTAPQAAGCEFDLVVVVGLTDPGWPARAGRDPLLTEQDRQRLDMGAPGELSAWRSRREETLLRAVTAAATQRLVVSWPRAEALTGRERVVSHLVGAVLGGALKGAGEGATPSPPGGAARSGGSGRTGAAAVALDLPAYDVAWARRKGRSAIPYLERRYPEAAAGSRGREARWSRRLTEWDGLLPGEQVASTPGRPGGRGLSATALQRYARCPRLFLFQDVLGAYDESEPEEAEGLAGLTRGQVMHRALELFFRGWLSSGPAAGGAVPARVGEAVARAVEESYPALAALPGVARIQTEILAAAVTRFVQAELERLQQDGFEVDAVEERFSGVPLDLGGGRSVELDGRMDRIDVKRGPSKLGSSGRDVVLARVVDYKSSVPPPGLDPARLQGGLLVQLPVYVLAAARRYGLAARACQAELVYVGGDGEPKAAVLAGDAWASLEPRLRELVAGMVGSMQRGAFFAAPYPGRQSCDRCPFYAVCGPEAERQASRKDPTPEHAAIEAWREIDR